MGSAVVLALLALAAATDGPSRAPTPFSETTQPSDDTIAGTLTMNIVPISGPGFDELDAVVARALSYCTSTNIAIAEVSAANDFTDDADCYDTGVCPVPFHFAMACDADLCATVMGNWESINEDPALFEPCVRAACEFGEVYEDGEPCAHDWEVQDTMTIEAFSSAAMAATDAPTPAPTTPSAAPTSAPTAAPVAPPSPPPSAAAAAAAAPTPAPTPAPTTPKISYGDDDDDGDCVTLLCLTATNARAVAAAVLLLALVGCAVCAFRCRRPRKGGDAGAVELGATNPIASPREPRRAATPRTPKSPAHRGDDPSLVPVVVEAQERALISEWEAVATPDGQTYDLSWTITAVAINRLSRGDCALWEKRRTSSASQPTSPRRASQGSGKRCAARPKTQRSRSRRTTDVWRPGRSASDLSGPTVAHFAWPMSKRKHCSQLWRTVAT